MSDERRAIKQENVQFRVDESQKAALERKAREEGDTLGNWARRNLLRLAGWKPEPSGHSTP